MLKWRREAAVLDVRSLVSGLLSTMLPMWNPASLSARFYKIVLPCFCDPFCCQSIQHSQTDGLLAKPIPSCSARIQNRFSRHKFSSKTSPACAAQPGSSGCWYYWEKEVVEVITGNRDWIAFSRKKLQPSSLYTSKNRLQVAPPFPRTIPSPSLTCFSCLT